MPHSTVDRTALDAARDVLRHADHVLIGAGAGLSTAAGLAYDGPDSSARSARPHCPVCGAPMAVNIRCDAAFVEDDAWHLAEHRYRQRLASACDDGNTVLLELGVGWNTPVWIRYPFERIAQRSGASLIRINADPTTMRPPTALDGRSYLPLNGDIAALLPALLA